MDQEQRRFTRFKFNTSGTLRIERPDTEPTLIEEPVLIQDLSLKGVLLRGDSKILQKIAICDSVDLTIPLEDDGPVIQMTLKLAHQQQDIAGFNCETIDIDSITHLRRMAELNHGDPKVLERDLEALHQG